MKILVPMVHSIKWLLSTLRHQKNHCPPLFMNKLQRAAATFSSTAHSSRRRVEQDVTTTTKTTTTIMMTNERLTSHSIVLLMENSRKNNNWGPVLRCASAFGIQTVVFVGFAQCSVRGAHGADQHVQIIAFPTVQQAVDFLHHEYFRQHHDDLDDANNNINENDTSTTCTSPRTTTTTENSMKIIGLLGAVPGGYSNDGCVLRHDDDEGTTHEIDKSSKPAGLVQAVVAEDHVYDSSTTMSPSWCSSRRSYPVSSSARMRHLLSPETTETVVIAISKDLHGLPMRLAQHCDAFCHVPHVAIPDRTADCDSTSTGAQQMLIPPPSAAPPPRPLLDLPTTLSIALHHITAHLGYREGEFQGHKFQVFCSKNKTLQNEQDDHQRKTREHRANQQKCQEQLASDAMDNDGGLLCLWQEEQSDDY